MDRTDFRQNSPRYAWENLAKNRERFAPFIHIAEELDVTSAQLALAWLLHQGQDIVPIRGTRRPDRIDENAKAADIDLNDETLARIIEVARPGAAEGATLV